MEILRIKFGLMVLLVAGGLLSTYMLYKNLAEASIRLDSWAEDLFRTAVALDKDIREREVSAYRRIYIADEREESGREEPEMITIRSTDTLIAFQNTEEFQQKLREEKNFIIDQIYLLYENPIRVSRLDSLYRTLLAEAKLPVAQAIVYETKQGKSYSCPDSGFYQKARPLKEYVIGVNREIVLQAYVRFPPGYMLGQAWPACLICLVVWAGCVGAGVHLYRQKKRLAFSVVPLPEPSPCLTGITDNLLFDEANGILHYKDRRVELMNYRWRLFVVLLQHRGEYLSSEQLRREIWEDGLSGKDALAQTVKRLRDDLAAIPPISIENVRGKGYCLRIKSPAGDDSAGLQG